ncbi:MerR-like DNA binding protein [Ruminococcaceae bacterium R-25]|nr:MerR-like DNA binding protein [Ruminococcaceae bacterium R-25]SUQ22536.1 MerR family regulatory protein [Oscillospiraceae bacterium]
MTIKEVCEKYDITPDTLRYYERVGVIPAVTRTAGGIRYDLRRNTRWVKN